MNSTTLIGWAILFFVVGVCAFVWDRELDGRRKRRPKESFDVGKRRATRFPLGTIVSFLGISAYTVAMGQLYLAGDIFMSTIVVITVFLSLVTLVLISIIWFVTDLFLRGKVMQELRRAVSATRFQLRHLMIFLTLFGMIAGIVRVTYPNDPLIFWLFGTTLLTIFSYLLGAVAYLGVDTLFFGRGSGRRANRTRELEDRQDDEF